MTGTISDSACGVSHSAMMAQHSNLKSDKDCTLACVKSGAKYVLVSGGKVYNIANQDMKELQANAGENVTVTADVKGDTITVSKIAKEKK